MGRTVSRVQGCMLWPEALDWLHCLPWQQRVCLQAMVLLQPCVWTKWTGQAWRTGPLFQMPTGVLPPPPPKWTGTAHQTEAQKTLHAQPHGWCWWSQKKINDSSMWSWPGIHTNTHANTHANTHSTNQSSRLRGKHRRCVRCCFSRFGSRLAVHTHANRLVEAASSTRGWRFLPFAFLAYHCWSSSAQFPEAHQRDSREARTRARTCKATTALMHTHTRTRTHSHTFTRTRTHSHTHTMTATKSPTARMLTSLVCTARQTGCSCRRQSGGCRGHTRRRVGGQTRCGTPHPAGSCFAGPIGGNSGGVVLCV